MSELSRRSFAQILGTAAVATALPIRLQAAPALVRLSANENPFGPSAAALNAIREAFPLLCRYPDEPVDELVADVARLHVVSTSQVLLGDGSGEILKLAAAAFVNAGHPLVQAEPTFEAIASHARAAGGEVKRIPLNGRHEHDLGKMLEAARGAGLVYICNPNNPTATITPNTPLRDFIAAVPAETAVLVDEAYHHYAMSPEYATLIDLVARHRNLIVSRTFSKIYGMAGLRCGYCIAQEQTIRKLSAHQAWDTINILAAVAARASLGDSGRVVEHRKLNAQTRAWVRSEVERLGHTMLASEANFVMIDVGREVTPLIRTMRERGVAVGRLFPAMPNHMRVTIGKPDEMRRFVEEFAKVV